MTFWWWWWWLVVVVFLSISFSNERLQCSQMGELDPNDKIISLYQLSVQNLARCQSTPTTSGVSPHGIPGFSMPTSEYIICHLNIALSWRGRVGPLLPLVQAIGTQQSFRLFLWYGPSQCTASWICVLLKRNRYRSIDLSVIERCRTDMTQVNILLSAAGEEQAGDNVYN